MTRLEPHPLWVGHAGDGRGVAALAAAGVRAVVFLAGEEPPVPLPRDWVACRFPLADGAGNDPAVLTLAVATVAALVRGRVPTLVCCGAGMSRSPAVAAAALAAAGHGTPADGLRLVSRGRPVDVSPGLWADLLRPVAAAPG